MPGITWNLLHTSAFLREAMKVLRMLCLDGIVADAQRARELLDRSTAAATALSPYIGYAETAAIAKEAVKTGKTIRALVLERGLLDANRLDEILSVDAMTRGGRIREGRDSAGRERSARVGLGRKGQMGRIRRMGLRSVVMLTLGSQTLMAAPAGSSLSRADAPARDIALSISAWSASSFRSAPSLPTVPSFQS